MAEQDDYTNNTSTTGQFTNPDHSQVFGALDFGGDEDWFKVNLTVGKSYYFADYLEISNERLDREEYLHDATGKRVAFISPEGGTIFTPEKSGTYYLSVWTFSASFHLGGYAVGIKSFVDDYSDSIKMAKPIQLVAGQAAWQGSLQVSIDVDMVSLPNKPRVVYLIDLDSTIYNAKILNAQGQNKSLVLSDGLLMTPNPGKYYLQIGDGFYYYGYNATETPYSVTITEYLLRNGSKQNDVLTAILGNTALNGQAGNDTLNGSVGDDLLNGGTGKDVMLGGFGKDTYLVDNAGDRVIEIAVFGSGIDTVYSTISYQLPANVENLILSTANAKGALTGYGNGLNNRLVAESGFPSKTVVLNGGAGHDFLKGTGILIGGRGNDVIDGAPGSRLIGGIDKDTAILSGNGKHTLTINPGDSLVNQFDIVKQFKYTSDFIQLTNIPVRIAGDVASNNGQNTGQISSHRISSGIISFDDDDQFVSPLTITAANVVDAVNYVQANIKKSGNVVAFVAGKDTYVFQDNGAQDTLLKLHGVNSGKNMPEQLITYKKNIIIFSTENKAALHMESEKLVNTLFDNPNSELLEHSEIAQVGLIGVQDWN